MQPGNFRASCWTKLLVYLVLHWTGQTPWLARWPTSAPFLGPRTNGPRDEERWSLRSPPATFSLATSIWLRETEERPAEPIVSRDSADRADRQYGIRLDIKASSAVGHVRNQRSLRLFWRTKALNGTPCRRGVKLCCAVLFL